MSLQDDMDDDPIIIEECFNECNWEEVSPSKIVKFLAPQLAKCCVYTPRRCTTSICIGCWCSHYLLQMKLPEPLQTCANKCHSVLLPAGHGIQAEFVVQGWCGIQLAWWYLVPSWPILTSCNNQYRSTTGMSLHIPWVCIWHAVDVGPRVCSSLPHPLPWHTVYTGGQNFTDDVNDSQEFAAFYNVLWSYHMDLAHIKEE